MLPALPVIGQPVNGARLWVDVGGIRFQPGELAKIMLIVFLAGYLREKREVLAQGRLKDFGPLLFDLGRGDARHRRDERPRERAPLLRDLPRDAVRRDRARPGSPARGSCSSSPGPPSSTRPCRGSRSESRSGSTRGRTPRRAATRSSRRSYSIANGGFGGTGFGKGTFENTGGGELIPYLHTDFIYSALGQELGLVGAAALLLVYMLFCLRGFRIALLAQDGFSKLLAVGLTFGFALQTFIIVGGVLRIIPLTGITLPFVSYGGSSIVANFVLLAGLLLVSHRANSVAQIAMEGRP